MNVLIVDEANRAYRSLQINAHPTTDAVFCIQPHMNGSDPVGSVGDGKGGRSGRATGRHARITKELGKPGGLVFGLPILESTEHVHIPTSIAKLHRPVTDIPIQIPGAGAGDTAARA